MTGILGSLSPFQVFDLTFLGLLCALALAAVVVFILVAIWMYRDAESRRMSAGLWVVALILASLFFSFVGGIIVLVIYLIVRSDHPVGGYPSYYGAPPPGYYPYPQPAAPPPPPTGVVGSPGMAPQTHCRNCGAPLAPGAAFCVNCGTRV